VRRLDPWPEGYRMIVRVRQLPRHDAILLARAFRAWPIHTHTWGRWVGNVGPEDPRYSEPGYIRGAPRGAFTAAEWISMARVRMVGLFEPWLTTRPAWTPEEAADLWAAADDLVITPWEPPANFTGYVTNPTGEEELRLDGRFEWREPEDSIFSMRPREDR
jgi:hypothetical protein